METYYFKGVYLTFNLYNSDLEFFDENTIKENFYEDLTEFIKNTIMEMSSDDDYEIIIEEKVLKITWLNKKLDYQTILFCESVAYKIRDYYLEVQGPKLKQVLNQYFGLD